MLTATAMGSFLRTRFVLLLISALAAMLGLAGLTQASEVQVAVAANFMLPMKKIAAAFEQDTGYKTALAFGSTGKFYAQIKQGAPFHVLLAADAQTPARLSQEGLAVAGSSFTYAVGRLVLWSKRPGLVDAEGAVLGRGNFSKLALADPRLAPYGAAAVEALAKLGLLEQLRPRFVFGDSVSQAYLFVATENATLGFVAMSQVLQDGVIVPGSAWLVPGHLHEPIRQDAVLLAGARQYPGARALMGYLQGERARQIIRSAGYELR